MTNEEMKAQIESTAKAARRAGGKVEIFRCNGQDAYTFEGADSIIVIPIKESGEYCFHYSAADEMRKEALGAAEKFDVEPEDYLLWVSQGW
jgi:hypothetical protein